MRIEIIIIIIGVEDKLPRKLLTLSLDFQVITLDYEPSFWNFLPRKKLLKSLTWMYQYCQLIAGSLEAAYSLNWVAWEIWGKGGGETLALL